MLDHTWELEDSWDFAYPAPCPPPTYTKNTPNLDHRSTWIRSPDVVSRN
jgi:hypothetical protein